ncbi:signal peptidase I [Kocuria sp. M1R5S2]|uniref:signal peptidase I n=1 Tax=Kocuria rhizosphaerae TaxID=3376285 RepID=UPI0037B9A2F4
MSTVLRAGARSVLGFLLAGVCAGLLAVAVVPLVLGWVPLSVLSGSMAPGVPTGSQVVVEPLESRAEVARLRPGDVVSFVPAGAGSALVTHRIVAIHRDADGAPLFTTRGDANAAPDPEPVPADRLRGVVRYHVPWAGRVATLLDPQQKRVGTVLVAAALLGYAVRQAAGPARDRPRATARS